MPKKLEVYEVVMDDDAPETGVQAISLVESPAMEHFAEFITLSNEQAKKVSKMELATVDEEKRLLMGAVLVPNKPVYRRDGAEEYYIIFSKDTISKASQLYMKQSNQSAATYEHQMDVNGMTVVETWLKEDMINDKSAKYGLNAPVGSWIVSMKAENDEVWQDAKSGKVKGFSIEGYFVPKLREDLSKQKTEAEKTLETIKEILTNG